MQSALVRSAMAGLLAMQSYGAVAPPRTPHNHTHDGVEESIRKRKENGEVLTVHLMPHSHDDIGWLKTPDEYFTGARDDIAFADVEMVITTVVDELLKDPKKRFTQVEMKFFEMWWNEQTDEMKDNVRMLAKEGRLEFINAGWSMHDEACTHVDDMMNNHMIGHEFLEREIGEFARPKIGWQVDPFGHSSTNPRLFAEMGFKAWFFARLDYQDKRQRLEDKSMEFVWRPYSESLGDNVEIFTVVMPDHYNMIDDFRFDERFNTFGPLIVDPNLDDYNADVRMQDLYNYITDTASHFRGSRMSLPWGDDFFFGNAAMTYKNLDLTIKTFNEWFDDVQLVMSTPSEYIDAIYAENIVWPTKYDDMFPYADQPQDYWTGYFTSRADAKKQDRQTAANLHASNKLYAQKVIQQNVSDEDVSTILDNKYVMMNALGIMQHHDAISGTAKQAVNDRYQKYLSDAVAQNNQFYAELIGQQAKNAGLDESLDWSACNVSTLDPTACAVGANVGDITMVSAYNPSTVDQTMMRFGVPAEGAYKAYILNGQQWDLAESDLMCYTAVKNDAATTWYESCELFVEGDVKAQGTTYVKVETVDAASENASVKSQNTKVKALENEYISLEFLHHDIWGHAQFNLTDKVSGTTTELSFSLKYYVPSDGSDGYRDTDNVASGAYIFKPMRGDRRRHMYSRPDHRETYIGDATGVQSHVLYYEEGGEIYSVQIRLLPGAKSIEWDVNLRGIYVHNNIGKEVIAYWNVNDINASQTFYTDSNGMEMQKRVIDHRDTFKLWTKEYESANYYPINSAIVARSTENNLQMTVMNDRSQGGSMLQDGAIELMQNRRLFYDDGRGVGESLYEVNSEGVGLMVNAKYHLQFFDRTMTKSEQRERQLQVDEPVQYFSATASSDAVRQSNSQAGVEVPAFDGELKIHMFPEAKNQILIRLENYSDLFDGAPESVPMFDLKQYATDLFMANNPGVSSVDMEIRERTITNNQDYSEMYNKRFHWQTVDGPTPTTYPADQVADQIVALQPQRIRLFSIKYSVANEAEVFTQ